MNTNTLTGLIPDAQLCDDIYNALLDHVKRHHSDTILEGAANDDALEDGFDHHYELAERDRKSVV